jgi:Fe2+ transport system protein FeoA
MKTLDQLADGCQANLVQLGGQRHFRRRLMELGLLPGTPVRVVRRADIGGVMELEVRRCRVTVRCSEARELLVDPV